MTTLFTHVLDGMESNNDINNAKFSDWKNADEAIDTYSDSHQENDTLSATEFDATVKALNGIISSGSNDLNAPENEKFIDDWNIAVWGQAFGNAMGSVAYRG